MTDDPTHQCPGCGYDLRGQALDHEFCPECGAFLTKRDPAEGAEQRMVLRRTHQTDDFGILVRNADLPPDIVKRHLTDAVRTAEAFRITSIVVLTFSVCVNLIGSLILSSYFMLPSPIDDHKFIFAVLVTAAHVLAHRIVIRRILLDRYIKRRVRTALRDEGFDLCAHCGWKYADDDATTAKCPFCKRPRKRLA